MKDKLKIGKDNTALKYFTKLINIIQKNFIKNLNINLYIKITSGILLFSFVIFFLSSSKFIHINDMEFITAYINNDTSYKEYYPNDIDSEIPESNNDSIIVEELEYREAIVVIDPGHGGEDLGVYEAGVNEKDLNLDISLKLGELLEEKNIKTVFTRTTDRFVTLQDRAYIANSVNAALFISVHNNSMGEDKNYRGTETLYCAPQVPYYSKMDGSIFADIVHSELMNTLDMVDNGTISRPDLYVLKSTAMPAVIAEIGYVTNKSDREKLTNEDFRQKAANALANAVEKALIQMDVEKDEDGKWVFK